MYSRGRIPIYTSEKEINANNIKDVLKKAMDIHRRNAKDIEYLIEYEKGNQPILNREKEVRPEINNKIVENHSHEITNFKVSYLFGTPVTYVQRAESQEASGVSALNEFMFEQGKASKDQQLARDFNICGVGYRMVLPNEDETEESPFRLIHLDPLSTFLVYSRGIGHKPMLGVSYYIDEDKNIRIGAYTDSLYFDMEWTNTDDIITHNVVINGIGAIPIVEYTNGYDRMGSFERALALLDAINLCTSDRLNGLAQFVQSFIWLNNVEITEAQAQELRDKMMLLTKSVDGVSQASVQYLTAELHQTEVQTLADYLYTQMLQIVGLPGRENNTGGDTGAAVSMRNGWQVAEDNAKATELVFCDSERKLLKVINNILDRSGNPVVKLSAVDVKFSRNRTDGLLVKTQGLMNLLQSGINPLKAIEVVGLFSDPQQVFKDSSEYLEKWLQQVNPEGGKPQESSGTEQQEIKKKETE